MGSVAPPGDENLGETAGELQHLQGVAPLQLRLSRDELEVPAAAATVRDQLTRGDLPPLAGFVGNAGLQLTRATEASVDGAEVTFAVNVLANYVLIDELREVFTPLPSADRPDHQ